ncbi:MAG: DNA polymerase IV [Clostridia bacterium]|nr:DNA polymerase IV [Clostridia bacterium]
MSSRLIFHIDVNSAFLSWEAAKRLQNGETTDLRLVPSAIGGDRESRRGIILAKSIPAKKYGIQTGEPIASALRKCPDLYIAPSDFRLYERSSKTFIAVCKKYAPVVEQFSIDECFLDMSGTARLYPDPLAIAHRIKDEIRNTLGFTVNVGIGSNKLLAKMASDFEKPDKVHTLFSEEIPTKLWPLPVGELFTVGRATATRLESARIMTVGELANTDPDRLRAMFGIKQGEHLFRYANGIDHSPVLGEAEDAKGYSNSTTLKEDLCSFEEAHRVLLALADSVTSRMRNDHRHALCVAVTIRGNDFRDRSHQKHLSVPTDVTSEVYEVAKKLFSELWDRRTPLRLLGISLSALTEEDGTQLSLFPDEKKERERQLDKLIDSIRGRFGSSTIVRGSIMQYGNVGKKHKAQADVENEDKKE